VIAHQFETLLEAWESARKPDSFGEEIAQQAMMLTLDRPGTEAREPAYFLTTCHWQRIHGYNDARGEQRKVRLKYKKEVLAPDPRLMREAVDTLTPERLLIIREEVSGIKENAVKALSGNYTSRSDPTVCVRGHEGAFDFRVRKDGSLHKTCRKCAVMRTRAYKQKKKGAIPRVSLNQVP
jgi:hypothetical protein